MTSEIEALAQELERHPDYKVLRRLTHTSVFNPALAGNKLCRGVVLDTETTGFDPQHDKVIELGMLLFDFDPVTGEIHKVLDVFDELEDRRIPNSTRDHCCASHHRRDGARQAD
jgi:DNA polymerase-3 subunit epsilon